MKALTFQGHKSIGFEEIADPIIEQESDAIVQVKCCGLCGSDLHVYHEREKGMDKGAAMGHEFCGEIVALGKEVKGLKKGDSVVSPFTTNCGNCHFCEIGLTARCVHFQLFGWRSKNEGLHGAQAEFVRVPMAQSTLVKYARHISPENALLTGDILSTGFYCADQAEINPKGNYAVIGCGPVGLMTILSAKKLGAEKLYAIDRIPERLRLAQEMGAIPINFDECDPQEQLSEATKGIGVDACMEAVGHPSASKLAVDLVRPGGIVSTVGVHNAEQFSFSPILAYDKNLTYKIGRSPARFYMDKLLAMLEREEIDPASIITHKIPLSEGVKAYEMFDKKAENCIKVIFTID